MEAMRHTTRLLRRAGTDLASIAGEAGLSATPLNGGRTTPGINNVSDMLGGYRHLSPSVRAAIRRLVPAQVADEVIALCDEAWEARNGG